MIRHGVVKGDLLVILLVVLEIILSFSLSDHSVLVICVCSSTASPCRLRLKISERDTWQAGFTYLTQRDSRINLDDAMEPTKEDGDRPEHDVDRIPHKVSNELDEFREKHPSQQSPDGDLALLDRPICNAPEQEEP